MQKTGAQLLVDNLVLHGVRRAYCVPGESYLGVLDALYDVREQIELIVNRQEGGACFMAEAHGKLTGEPGICFVTRGPGATNAAIGVHHAQQDSTPLILFIGQVGGDFVEREAFQEVDYRRMFGPLCKWVAQIDRAERVAEYVARAFQVATSGRPGPVVLALPEDMLSESVLLEPSPYGRGQGEGVSKEGKLPEHMKQFARDLRKNQTHAETLIWECLRDRRMNDQKFRRQHPVEHYVLDFYCHELKLAVELDGGQQNDEINKRKDAVRTAFLEAQGIRVLRFWNDEALVQTDEVLEQIWFATQAQLPPPSPYPLPEGEGYADLKRYTAIQATPSAADVQYIAQLLASAKTPFVILGGAGWTQAAAQQMQQFIERYQLPVGGAFRFCDVIDNAHPQYAGDVGIGINPKLAARVKNADVLLTIGARLGEMTTSGYTLIDSPRPQQTLIHVYNQPDDLGRVYQGELMVASGMPQIAASLAALPAPASYAWAGQAAQAHADLLAWQSEPALLQKEQPAVNQWQVVQTLKQLAPSDTIITNGAGNFATWANRYWPYQGLASCGHRTQLAPSSGSMGCGVPAAIAAKLQHPDTTVVCFAGDGDFLMTGQELATATQYGAGIVVLLFNNGMYGTIRMHQEKHFSARVHGTALVNPDFVALAAAYGGRGWLVTQTAQFEAALEEALAYAAGAKRPALIELMVDPNIITPGTTISAMRTAA